MPRHFKTSAQDQSLAALWAHAAHDLRQPVQAALLLTKMLDSATGQVEQKEAARHIEAALESLHGMLEILTLMSRVEAGLQTVRFQACQLPDMLAATMQHMRDLSEQRNIRLKFQNMRGRVRTNPTLFTTATKSLILNAIKFGSGKDIVVSCSRRGDQVRLEVNFTGIALDMARQRGAFVELPANGSDSVAGGLGLGLALLQRLCGRLGHTLTCTSLRSDAQAFTMVLPAHPCE